MPLSGGGAGVAQRGGVRPFAEGRFDRAHDPGPVADRHPLSQLRTPARYSGNRSRSPRRRDATRSDSQASTLTPSGTPKQGLVVLKRSRESSARRARQDSNKRRGARCGDPRRGGGKAGSSLPQRRGEAGSPRGRSVVSRSMPALRPAASPKRCSTRAHDASTRSTPATGKLLGCASPGRPSRQPRAQEPPANSAKPQFELGLATPADLGLYALFRRVPIGEAAS